MYDANLHNAKLILALPFQLDWHTKHPWKTLVLYE